MRKLTTMFHRGSADRLCQHLDAAGIDSEITNQEANTYLGKTNIAVWIDDRADAATANRILAEFVSHPLPPTRVDKADPDTLLCAACKYNLRGQVENGVCPECAHPYELITLWRCPKCNAENPSDFDLCWQCTAESDDPENADDSDQTTPE